MHRFHVSLLAKAKLMGDAQRFGTPVSTFAVKHDVVVVLAGSLHFKLLLKELRGKLQRLLEVSHCVCHHTHTQTWNVNIKTGKTSSD